MVLESLLNPPRAEKNPMLVFLLGMAYCTLAIFLSNWIFEEQSSMVMVFLTSLAALPLMYHTLKYEETKDMEHLEKKSMVREHAPAMIFFLTLFLGAAFAFTLWYIILPVEMTNNLFRVQTQTITNLNQHVTGSITQTALLSKIFLNNIKVLIFCILFSFLYGSGAIFILVWNASVIGAAAGNFIRSHMAQFAGLAGLQKAGAYLYVSSLSILRYAIHGVPEIFAYVIAGLAGGILSMALVKHDFGTGKFEKILLDVSDLVLLSVLVLFIAAIIEVFFTPALF
ncbi:MAG TPA: stage II sporulation protein M [Candidatus Nanoarchaeia archaeon]|nr:stage II sporulation protein M [Candidatus Nanoarchaeia archaeon]